MARTSEAETGFLASTGGGAAEWVGSSACCWGGRVRVWFAVVVVVVGMVRLWVVVLVMLTVVVMVLVLMVVIVTVAGGGGGGGGVGVGVVSVVEAGGKTKGSMRSPRARNGSAGRGAFREEDVRVDEEAGAARRERR